MRDDTPPARTAAPLLHAVDAGRGEVALLLHSSGMSSRQWKLLVERLAPTHRVIAPDLLGVGQNPPWPDDAPFHFDEDLAAVDRLLDAVAPGQRVHLVGHSYGGMLALTLARRDPSRVRSLAVYDPVAWGPLRGTQEPDVVADLARASGFDDDATGGTAQWFERFVGYWSGDGAWQGLSDGARAGFLRGGRKVFHEVMALIHDETPASAYGVIDAPALVLQGERTPRAARRAGELVAAAMPHATRCVVEGAGHMGPITHAAVVNEHIARHLDAARG